MELYYEHSDYGGKTEKERIVFIEYRDNKPFSVITWENGGGSEYDFEWCQRNGRLYFDLSGGRGAQKQVILSAFAEPKGRREKIWKVTEIELVEDRAETLDKSDIHPVGPGRLEEMGYELIGEPLDLAELSWNNQTEFNPFEAGEEGATIYCEICDDRMPREPGEYCRHLVWIEGGGYYGGCGSLEIQEETHRKGLEKVLEIMGLGEELIKAIREGKYEIEGAEEWMEGIEERLEVILGEKDYAERFEGLDEETKRRMEEGMAWLGSLEAGVTKEAEELTIKWCGPGRKIEKIVKGKSLGT